MMKAFHVLTSKKKKLKKDEKIKKVLKQLHLMLITKANTDKHTHTHIIYLFFFYMFQRNKKKALL